MKDPFINYDDWKLDNGEDGKVYQCEMCDGEFPYDQIEEIEVGIDTVLQLCDKCRDNIKGNEDE